MSLENLPLATSLDFARPLWLAGLAALALIAWMLFASRLSWPRWRKCAAATTRATILILLVLALAGALWRVATNRLFMTFLVDQSASISEDARIAAEEFVASARETAGDHESAVIDFAAKAVLRSNGLPPEFERSATNPASAVNTAIDLVPEARVPRIVLLSDGNETSGDLLAVAGELPAPIDSVPLKSFAEVALAAIEGPRTVSAGQTFDLIVTIETNRASRGSIEIMRDGEVVVEQKVSLALGVNEIAVATELAGIERDTFHATLLYFDDRQKENNQLEITVEAVPRPSVLLVHDSPDAPPLAKTLRSLSFNVSTSTTGSFPKTSTPAAKFDAVVLFNVSTRRLPAALVEMLKKYVEQDGGGLLVVGGDATFAAAEFAESPLETIAPVAALKRESADESLAMILVIDKSSSMREEGRMVLAKEAARRCIDLPLLDAEDRIGVLAFGDKAEWVSPLAAADDKQKLHRRIDALEAQGATNLYPALLRAFFALAETNAARRHVIVITDGVSAPGDFDTLATRMKKEDVTVSTVSVSPGADQILVKNIARLAGGRHYHCDDPAEMPQIVVAETQSAAAGPAANLLLLESLPGLDMSGAPALQKFTPTAPKPAAKIVLMAGSGDPILGWWNRGAGKVAAMPTTFAGADAEGWSQWKGYPQFWEAVLRRVLRRDKETASAAANVQHIEQSVLSENTELRLAPINEEWLRKVAQASGGRYNPAAAEIFVADGRTVDREIPLWRYLLMAAVCLFVIDVALKRLPAA